MHAQDTKMDLIVVMLPSLLQAYKKSRLHYS